ncbi:hypothetical protein [Moorena sp. SIO1G6]|nr:hypothetical protein [Moorena sp. SIO1G6]
MNIASSLVAVVYRGRAEASGVGYASPQQCYGFPHATTEMF